MNIFTVLYESIRGLAEVAVALLILFYAVGIPVYVFGRIVGWLLDRRKSHDKTSDTSLGARPWTQESSQNKSPKN